VEPIDRDVDGGAFRYDEVRSRDGVVLGAVASDERKRSKSAANVMKLYSS
jgi:hypothetical protein